MADRVRLDLRGRIRYEAEASVENASIELQKADVECILWWRDRLLRTRCRRKRAVVRPKSWKGLSETSDEGERSIEVVHSSMVAKKSSRTKLCDGEDVTKVLLSKRW